jgi:von Willebrand factor type A domain
MINITCTSCKKVLSIDDAFAGGVCRCQHCGTIQTVPARASSQKATAGAVKASKTLFENKARSAGTATGSGSGLDDLADVVQSSGLSDARLRKQPASPPPRPKNLMPLLGIAASAIIVLVVIIFVLTFHGSVGSKASTVATVDSNVVPDHAAPVNLPTQVLTPGFCGVPIDQTVVVYVVDNGSSSADVLDAIESALFKSIESLGPDRQFQILFWNPDTATYPTARQTAFAVKDNIDAARKRLQDVTAAGSTDPVSSLQRAIEDNPGQIMLITAKAGDLDDSLVDEVAKIRGNSKVRIDCFAINGVPGDKVLSKIASASAGVFVPVSEAQLKGFAQ